MKTIRLTTLAITVAAFASAHALRSSDVRIPPALSSGPQTSSPLALFRLEAPPATLERAEDLVRRFVEPSPTAAVGVVEGEYVFASRRDPSRFLTLDPLTGEVNFGVGLADYFGLSRPDLPDSPIASFLAGAFLRSSGFLPPDPSQLRLVHVGGMAMAAREPGSDGAPIDKLVTLHYARSIAGRPVVGSGSKIVLHLGHRGEVVGMIHKWRDAVPLRRLTATELVRGPEVIRAVRTHVAQTWSGATAAQVGSLEIVYYDGDGRFIQPAVAYTATIRHGLKSAEYLGLVPLMRRAPERVGLAPISAEALSRISEAARRA